MSDLQYFADACNFKPGDFVNNRYKIEKKLGEGSFGIVYKVTDLNGQSYALKILPLWKRMNEERAELVQRFKMEFETGRIKCPYLVRSFKYESVDGNPFILMEYCPKGNLYKLLDEPSPNFEEMACHILYGLQALHQNGKVHRDLKPENILVKDDGTVALSDFGTSGVITSLTIWQKLFHKVDIFGTFAYMAPEQAHPKKAKPTVLPTTDIFSFGVVLYEMLFREYPFGPLEKQEHLQPYLDKAQNGNWDRNRFNQSRSLQMWKPIIEGCLNPDYEARFQTVDEILDKIPHHHQGPVKISQEFKRDLSNGLVLRIMQGEEHGTVYNLNGFVKSGQHIVTMGRANTECSNSINLRDFDTHYISRRHLTLEYQDISNRWFVRDGQWHNNQWEDSTNGTYVNSREIKRFEGILLQAGDIVSIGEVKIRVEGA